MSKTELIEKQILLAKREIDGHTAEIVKLCHAVAKLEEQKKEILKGEK